MIRTLRDGSGLTCRVYLTYAVDVQMPLEKIEARLDAAVRSPLFRRNNMLWLHGAKIYIDGGMLTGSAYMLKPWGVSKIYSITRSAIPGYPVRRARAALPDRPRDAQPRLAVGGALPGRRGGHCHGRRLPESEPRLSRRPPAALHRAWELHDGRCDRKDAANRHGRRRAARLAVPRRRHARARSSATSG